MRSHRSFHRAAVLALWPLVATAALRAQSAIGQLESLTGQKIDRGRVNGSAPSGFGDASSALGAFTLGLEMINMLDAMGSGPQQDPAAQAIEEHMRMLERQRIQAQRMMTASRLRDFWDRQDMASSQTLGDALSAPVQGTAFFGQQASPGAVDASALPTWSMPAGVPLVAGGSPPAASAQPVGPVAPPDALPGSPAWSGRTAPTPSADHAVRFQEGVLAGKDWTREYAKDVGKEIVERCLDGLPGARNVDLMLEHREKMTDFIDQVVTALEPKRLVSALVHGRPEDVAAVTDGLDAIERRATGLGLADHGLESDELDTLGRWAQGQPPKMKEIMGHLTRRAKGWVVEKQVDRLLGGFD